MKLWAGTSGYSYKPWVGRFYPDDTPASGMLAYYASRLPAVEINQTFYRLPRRELLERWAGEVPAAFRFALKASRRITHQKRLLDAEAELGFLLESSSALGERLGALLFQLPPYLRLDLDRLRRFLDLLPDAARAAFEFRHASWESEDVHQALREKNVAIVAVDTEGDPPPLVATASFGYLRLRRPDYGPADLVHWTERIRAQPWRGAYVFFKHEDDALGPRLAQELLATAQARPDR